MPYVYFSFTALLVFTMVHLLAAKAEKLNAKWHARLLSAGGGIAIAYVFIDLLPKLSNNDSIVTQAFSGLFPYFERHAYIMALLGFLLFFIVDRAQTESSKSLSFWISLFSYTLFNFLIGYAVADPHNPEVKPLALFTLAIAMHDFTNDYSLSEAHGEDYKKFGKWALIGSLFLGWSLGQWFILSKTAVALVSAFIGGGVIMNVTRHELPKENPNSLGAFLVATFAYSTILLALR